VAQAHPPPRGGRPGARAPLGIIGVALGRYAAATAAGSVLLLAIAPAGVLAAFAVVALATLLVGVLDALGRPWVAGLGVAAGVAGAALERLLGSPFPGAAMLAGGTLALLVLIPAVLTRLARPARTLATSLWIP
jgi:hypothetical protein